MIVRCVNPDCINMMAPLAPYQRYYRCKKCGIEFEITKDPKKE